MRKLTIFNVLLLGALAPALLAMDGDDKARLRRELQDTLAKLADLAGIQQELDARESAGIARILALSEPGPADLALAEFELQRVRDEVSGLQERVDSIGLAMNSGDLAALSSSEPSGPDRPHFVDVAVVPPVPVAAPNPTSPTNATVTPNAAPIPAPEANPHTTPIPAVAISAAQSGSEDSAAQTALTAPRGEGKIAFEEEAFVADRSRLGRACWRGGRYLEGVGALEPLAGDPSADYWRARCLEKLGRNEEALALFGKVIELAPDSPEGRSAREDREYLQWTMSHGLAVRK